MLRKAGLICSLMLAFTFNLKVNAAILSGKVEKTYVIDEKDSIALIYNSATGSTNYGKLLLLPNGNIYAPLIGEVKAVDLTGKELEAKIEKEIKAQKDLDIDVDLIVHHTNIKISVIGAVNRPGTYDTNNIKTIYDALASAGGFNPVANKRKVKLIRQYEDGHRETEYINFPKEVFNAYDQGVGRELYLIEEGDIIWVPTSKIKQAWRVILSAAKIATIGLVSGVISAQID